MNNCFTVFRSNGGPGRTLLRRLAGSFVFELIIIDYDNVGTLVERCHRQHWKRGYWSPQQVEIAWHCRKFSARSFRGATVITRRVTGVSEITRRKVGSVR